MIIREPIEFESYGNSACGYHRSAASWHPAEENEVLKCQTNITQQRLRAAIHLEDATFGTERSIPFSSARTKELSR